MPPEHWERIKELFDSAAQLSLAGRGEYLDQECATDPSLRSEVERLLLAHDQAGDFLLQPAVQPGISFLEDALIANRYRVIHMLGRGGMGEVYEVEDEMLHERVALKTLRADLAMNEAYLRRFKREIHLARKVTHPNVCRVFEVGEHVFPGGARPPAQFFSMELLRGETLAARIRRLKQLPRNEAFPIAVQLAEGLQAAHEAGIVHTDFKSGNVMLCPSMLQGSTAERAVITDFGLARVNPRTSSPDQVETVSAALQLAGTLGYMSPEQLTGGSITPASDLYSFGIVLYEMATGGLPFDNRHPINAAVQRMAAKTTSARTAVPNLDPRWDAAIVRCLQPDPAKRFASAKDLADWFREGVWRLPVQHWTRRQWIGASAAGAAVVVGGGATWAWLTRPYQPNPAALQWYEKGLDAYHSMTYETARREFEMAVAADPQFALAHANLARTYDWLDLSDLAQKSMLRAVSVAQDTRQSVNDQRRLRALQYMVSRDYTRAEPLLREIEEAAPNRDKAVAALETAWAAQNGENPRSAQASFERSSRLDPSFAPAKLGLAVNHGLSARAGLNAALQAFSEAEALFNAAGNFEGLTESLYQKATILNRSDRNTDALAVIDRALVLTNTTGNRYQQIRLVMLQGAAFRALGDSDRARDVARQAVAVASEQHMETAAITGLINLANVFFARGEPNPAEQYYLQSLELTQRNKNRRTEARARLQYGAFCVQYHRDDEAERYIQDALSFYRQTGYRRELTQAGLLTGEIHEHRGELRASEQVLREAVASAGEQNDAELRGLAHFALGGVLSSRGKWPEALSEVELSLSLFKTTLQLTYATLDCGGLYSRLGRATDAEASFERCLTLLSKLPGDQAQLHARYYRQRAEMLYDLGKYGEASKLASDSMSASAQLKEIEKLGSELLVALIKIRLGQIASGKAACEPILREYSMRRNASGLASARLAEAEALVKTVRGEEVAQLARQSLEFFEPQQIWESVWRCHWAVAAATSTPLDPAKDAIDKLRQQWPPGSFSTYRKMWIGRNPELSGVFG